MIFCSTRKGADTTSAMLAELWHRTNPPQRLWDGPKHATDVKDSELRSLCTLSLALYHTDSYTESVTAAVAFHHGGLDPSDRTAVEQGFLNGQIKIICSTSTLAVGVNLPCYLVILKGTTGWSDAGPQEYSNLEIMQMLGRAGRPQYERSACAAILTRTDKVTKYQKMISGEEVLESCLHQNLIDHLNAEIGLGTIRDLESAKRWLAGTFLHVRLQRNPAHYQFKEDLACRDEDELLHQLCEKDILLLQNAQLVSLGDRLKGTEFGDIMARYYVKFDTMKSFMALPPRAKTSEIVGYSFVIGIQKLTFHDSSLPLHKLPNSKNSA